MKSTFYSNGKLLITGEYVVLDGAKALAVPTKFGQDLAVTSTKNSDTIEWKSRDFNKSIWFETTLIISDIVANKFLNDEEDIRKVLQKMLYEAHRLNPTVLSKSGFSIETNLSFPRFWGLGTSSTLINNIAQWFNINAFELLNNSFGGSGYDIACAQNNSPIIYHLHDGNPIVETVFFNPVFKNNIYFLYLNQKQNSKAAIATYYSKQHNIQKTKIKINAITQSISTAKSLKEFEYLLHQHETLMSDILELKTVRERYFTDFSGTIKSLGAWGGDFAMVVSDENPKLYFQEKGFSTLLTYDEMIL